MAACSSKRRVSLAGLVLFLSSVLAGCSPDMVTGVGVAPDGLPMLRNCGAVFRSVTAADSQSGRVVWSAEKRAGTSEFSVDEVTIGQLRTQIGSSRSLSSATTVQWCGASRFSSETRNRGFSMSPTVTSLLGNSLCLGDRGMFPTGFFGRFAATRRRSHTRHPLWHLDACCSPSRSMSHFSGGDGAGERWRGLLSADGHPTQTTS